MKLKTKLFLKIFLISGVGFALFMGLQDLAFGDAFSPWKIVFYFLFFGLFMASLSTSYHFEMLKGYGVKVENFTDLKAIQKRDFKFAGTLQELHQLMQDSNFYSSIILDTEKNRITARTSLTFESWGEKVQIVSLGAERYSLTCKSTFPLTIMDFGKNKINLVKFENLLSLDKLLVA